MLLTGLCCTPPLDIPAGLSQLQPAALAVGWRTALVKELNEDEVYYLAQFAIDCKLESPQPTL